MRVLIVEDERDMVEAISLSLRFQWPDCEVAVAEDGAAAVELAQQDTFDLMLLDLGLPRLDGFQVLREVRVGSAVPVIIITARGEELDKVRGLELGADDYVTKPFSHLELLARVKAVLRRVDMPPPGLSSSTSYYDGYLSIDYQSHQVKVAGAPVSLTPIEYNLLYHLVRNAGQVVPHRILLAKVWGHEYEDETDYLRVYLRRLREKLERDPDNPEYLLTERGLGYRFQRSQGTVGTDAGTRGASTGSG
ncbi:MAG: response regulator transcription factor [Chloroflexi bacterium]|nr:response regulator transcription factor [Chloroflexota bacterium]